MKTLDLDAVQTFALTAAMTNFTRVAEATGTTQSAVSLKLKRLETFLGKRLFERTPRAVRLTDDGAAFLDHARILLAANERALTAQAAPLHRLRLGISDQQKVLLVEAMPELKPRANTLDQLADGARFLFAPRPLDVDDAAAALLTPDARALLAAAHKNLVALAKWEAESLEAAIREVAESSGVKLGKLAQPLRAALTGRTTSPGIFDVLALLGREESLGRIADQMEPKE